MLRYAETHRADKNGALALLLLGATENDQRQFGDALAHLKTAGKRLPELADYTGYLSAVAESGLRQFADTASSLQPVWQSTPASPLVAKAVWLQAESFLEGGNPAGAATLVQQHLADLSAPQAELLLAQAYSAQNDAAQNNADIAAQHYRKIYIEYPLSKEAADAEVALARYPSLPADALFARGLKLESGGDYTRAGKELTALLARLSGENYDLARVRIGAAAYLARENEAAYKYLISFEAATPASEAERLYYLLESQRRLNRLDEMNATLQKMAQSYPQSHWRLEALISAGNYYAAHDQPEIAQPLYRTCYESFAADPQSAGCHWNVTWSAYLQDPAPAEGMLREHLTRYPSSDQVEPSSLLSGPDRGIEIRLGFCAGLLRHHQQRVSKLLLRDARPGAPGDSFYRQRDGISRHQAVSHWSSIRQSACAGKLRSESDHQAAHCPRPFAGCRRPGRFGGRRAALRR